MAAAIIAIKNQREKKNRAAVSSETSEEEDAMDGAPAMAAPSPRAGAGARAPAAGSSSQSSAPQESPNAAMACCRNTADVLPFQKVVREVYHSNNVQIFVAVLITTNFLCTIAEKEIDPFPDDIKQFATVWFIIDQVFTWCFVVELIANMYGAAFSCNFWNSGWNLFDFVIVLISVLSSTGALQGPLSMLKILRAFRVFRLFKRVPALNKIITSLFRAIPGVMNAFIIMVIIMSIYAIIGVEVFRDFGEGGTFTSIQQLGVEPYASYPNTTVSSVTMRGFYYGEEYFGTFMRALFTLFQVLTGESWAEMVARPLLFGYPSDSSWFFSAFYFSSYIVVMQIVLVNVVVAVLLDKFVEEPPKDEAGEASEEDEAAGAARAADKAAAHEAVAAAAADKPRHGRVRSQRAQAEGLHV